MTTIIPIQNVPVELLVETLGKLPKKDLKTARLVCTLWSTAGAKWMFQRVYFAPRKASMKVFSDIAADPAFARNVKELIYDGRLFLPEFGTFAHYDSAFSARMIEELDVYEDYKRSFGSTDDIHFADDVYQGSIWNMESLGAGDKMKRVFAGDSKEYSMNVADSWVRYAHLLEQQEKIFTKGEDLKALREGLKSFRSVTKVEVSTDFDHYLDYNLRTGVTYNQYIDWHQWYCSQSYLDFGLAVPPSNWCRRPHSQDGGAQDREEHIKWDVRGIQNLFRAITTHCPNLEELHVGSECHRAPMTIFHLSDDETKEIRPMARRLRTLRIYPYITRSDDRLENAREHKCLEIFLREAKELRILYSSSWALNYDELEESDDENQEPGTDFGLLLGKQWPKLTELSLSGACMEAKDLMSILRAHKESIRKLSLRAMGLFGEEGWDQFGKEVGQILKLHFVCVSDLYGDDLYSDDSYNDDFPVSGYPWPKGEEGHAIVRNMMQWVLPNLLEIREDDCNTGSVFTGTLKAAL